MTVTQPLNATLEGDGSVQTVAITGCGINTNFRGNGAVNNEILDASCKATLTLPSGYSWQGNGTATTLPASCSSGSCSVFALFYVKTHPFIAGYMTGTGSGDGFLRENAVRTTVTFKGTPQSDVQSDNDLSAGMFVSSFSNKSYEDFGFRAEAVLPGTGSKYLLAQVVETCEGYLIGYSTCALHCAFACWKSLIQNTTVVSFSASDNVTLEMKWSGGTVHWYYQINGGTNSSYFSFTMPTEARHTFVIGMSASSSDIGRFFEFGIDSCYNIGNTGWKVGICNPQYRNGTGGWTSVSQANLGMGSHAYVDNAIRWDGGDYIGVSACYADNSTCTLPSYYLTFSSATTTISDGTRLWG